MFGNGNCCWIVLILIILFACGWGNNGCGCGNNDCGCNGCGC